MQKKRKSKRRSPKGVLRLPDLDHSKASVLQSLGSPASKRTYGFAIDDFICWYCSEPRLTFGRTVVLRYRYELEARRLAPATINLRLAAVRRLAYEASDSGLLSPDLAASIRRVKGAKRLGVRLGNWLTQVQGRRLLDAPERTRVKGKRYRAMLTFLLGCGLRRSELIGLNLSHLQSEMTTGPLLIFMASVGTSAPFLSRPGSKFVWMSGSPPRRSKTASCSDASLGMERCGVQASLKR
jgi:integrase